MGQELCQCKCLVTNFTEGNIENFEDNYSSNVKPKCKSSDLPAFSSTTTKVTTSKKNHQRDRNSDIYENNEMKQLNTRKSIEEEIKKNSKMEETPRESRLRSVNKRNKKYNFTTEGNEIIIKELYIQKIIKGYLFRKNLKKIKPQLQQRERLTIGRLNRAFKVDQYKEIEKLNPKKYTKENFMKLNKNNSKEIKFKTKALVENYDDNDEDNEESTYYIGEVNINNQKSGYGVLYFISGKKLEGIWENNELNGIGILSDLNEESTYQGTFQHSRLEGKGYKYMQDYTYIGNFHENYKSGEGTEETNLYCFTGNFEDDKKKGFGKLKYKKTNDYYEGNFEDNSINGKGTYIWGNKQKYKGDFIYGQLHGYGIYTWPDGSIFKGNYINNLKEGYGEFLWANGKNYKGNFKEGVPDGKGILIVNGVEKKIQFSEGKIIS